MQKQKENLSTSMAKLVMAVSLIVGVGAVLGVVAYFMMNKTVRVNQPKDLFAPSIKENVNVATDKSEYKQGETIKITIQNNLNQSIGFWDYSGQITPFVGIQKFQNEKWEKIESQDACACKKNCTTFSNGWVELKSNEIINGSWDTKTDCAGKTVSEGKYRAWFSYSLNLTGQEGNPTDVYSKEFDIIKSAGDETADWKTYRNEEYGFEFKYPSELALEAKKDEQASWKSISVFMKSSDFNGYILINNAGVGTGFGIDVSSEDIRIDNVNTKLEILDSSINNERATKVSFNENNNEYFWLYRFNKEDYDKIKLSKEIYSTFKFIEPEEKK